MRPGKVICIGLNYVDHAKEGGPDPDYPAVSCVHDLPGRPRATDPSPAVSEKLDYEAELAIIIGRPSPPGQRGRGARPCRRLLLLQ